MTAFLMKSLERRQRRMGSRLYFVAQVINYALDGSTRMRRLQLDVGPLTAVSSWLRYGHQAYH